MAYHDQFLAQREQVAAFMRRLYRQGLTSCSGGNISLRVSKDLVLMTPSTLDKGELSADQVVLLTFEGEVLSENLKPTMEFDLHLETLRRRPDMNAVVHAHPVFATAFSCLGMDIETSMTPETMMTIRKMIKAPFYPAGTRELALATAGAFAEADVVVMRNHGIAAIGTTLLKAFDRLEVTEISAKMTWVCRTLGRNPAMESGDKDAMLATLM